MVGLEAGLKFGAMIRAYQEPFVGWTERNVLIGCRERLTRARRAIPGVFNRVPVQALGDGGVEVARTNLDIWFDDGAPQNVSGAMAANTTWTAAGGPYQITATLTINSGAPPTAGTGLVDSDGDGIPDARMVQYFGHPTGQASDNSLASQDANGDGMTNLEEYLAGTSPINPADNLRLLAITASSPVTLQFHAVAGKSYSVLYCDALGAGSWRKLADVAAASPSRLVAVTDPTPNPAGRFYRLVTPAQP